MYPSYTRTQLESKTRNELWKICDSLSISRRRSKADCVEAILAAQPQKVADVELTQEQQDELKRQANQQGYEDGVAGKPRQLIDDLSYLSGYLRGQRDAWVPPADYDGSDIEPGSVCKDGVCEVQPVDFRLVQQSAELCQQLANRITEATNELEYAKKTRDLDTFVSVHFSLEKLRRIWSQADKTYKRRLEQAKLLVAA